MPSKMSRKLHAAPAANDCPSEPEDMPIDEESNADKREYRNISRHEAALLDPRNVGFGEDVAPYVSVDSNGGADAPCNWLSRVNRIDSG